MLNTVVDHDVRMPDFVWGKVDSGDVFIVGGHPLESGVCPSHDKPDMGIKSAHLRIDIDVERDNIQTKCHSSEHSVDRIIKRIIKALQNRYHIVLIYSQHCLLLSFPAGLESGL